MTIAKNISLDKLLNQVSDKKFAINVITELVKQDNLIPLEAAEYLLNSGIDSRSSEIQAGLIEIAKICAQKDGAVISYNIAKFRIDASTQEGQLAMIEIAKIALQNDPLGTFYDINNYSIHSNTDEEKVRYKELSNFIFISSFAR